MYTEKGTFGTLESKETTKEKVSRKIFQSKTKKKKNSSFCLITAFFAAGQYVANISKVNCWSCFCLVCGGTARPTSCSFTSSEFHPLPREAHPPPGQTNGSVSVSLLTLSGLFL